MRVLKKQGLLLSLLVLFIVGCSGSVQSIDDAMAQYTAECSDTGTSNKSVNTKLVGQTYSIDIALVDKNTGALASLTNDALAQINTITSDMTEATSQAACESGSAVLTDLSQGGVVRSVLGLVKNLNSKQTLSNLSVSQPHKQIFCRANILSTDGKLYRKCAASSFAARPANFVMDVVEPAGIKKAADGSMIVAAGEGGESGNAKSVFTLRVRAVGLNNNTNALSGFVGSTLNFNLSSGQGLSKLLPLNKLGTNNQASSLAFKGILSPANFTFNNGEATAKLTYSEVGYLNIDQGALVDNVYTQLDASAGRCVVGDTSNSPNSQGRIGCGIGSVLARLPVKFVPYQLKIDSPVTKTVADSGNSCSKFAYFGGEVTTNFALKAVNSVGNVTQNYNTASGLAIFNATDYSKYNIPVATVKNSVNQDTQIIFQKADATNAITASDWVNGISQISLKHQVSRPSLPVAPATLAIKATPTDGEVDTASINADNMSSVVEYRYGKVKLANAYGSETMALNYDVEARYYKNNSWILNVDDSCSTISADMFKVVVPTNNPRNRMAKCRSTLGVKNSGIFNSGRANMTFTAPGHGSNGWFYVTLKQDGVDAADDESCVTGLGSIKAKIKNAVPQFGNQNSNTALVSFGQYKSKTIYSGEQ